jgi:hypothetical protein
MQEPLVVRVDMAPVDGVSQILYACVFGDKLCRYCWCIVRGAIIDNQYPYFDIFLREHALYALAKVTPISITRNDNIYSVH